jgi:hypothetical protein
MSGPLVWVQGSNRVHHAIYSTPLPPVPFLVGRAGATAFRAVRAAYGWLIRLHPQASAVRMAPESARDGLRLDGGLGGFIVPIVRLLSGKIDVTPHWCKQNSDAVCCVTYASSIAALGRSEPS